MAERAALGRRAQASPSSLSSPKWGNGKEEGGTADFGGRAGQDAGHRLDPLQRHPGKATPYSRGQMWEMRT